MQWSGSTTCVAVTSFWLAAIQGGLINQAGGDITKAYTQVANVGNAVAGDVGNLAQMGANAVAKVANSVVSSVSNTAKSTVKKIKKLFG